MKIAIENNNNGFVPRWVAYCQRQNIEFKIVDPQSSDIISELKDCDIFLWHWSHVDFPKLQFARQLTYSLESAGKIVFPDARTCWHFDDKVGQKYLLEASNAPLVPSYVFYDRDTALNWCKTATFPKVFKLRGGAGSANVRLMKTDADARKMIKKMFGKGIPVFDGLEHFCNAIWQFKSRQNNLINIFKAFCRMLVGTHYARCHGREFGYVYFQDFIPQNHYDIRVIVIGTRAFCIKRLCRKNDFRASGSGKIEYPVDAEAIMCVKESFRLTANLKTQCCAIDYVLQNETPLIVEISYGFTQAGYDRCSGYWDNELHFHHGTFNPQEWMLEDIISTCKNK